MDTGLDAALTGRALGRREVLRNGVRGLAALGVAGGLSGLLSACGSSGSDAAVQSTPGPANVAPTGRIRLLFQGSASDTENYKNLFDKFTAAYPGVTVEGVPDPSTTWAEFFQNVQVKVAGGQEFDLIYLPTEGQRLFASKDLLQPIDAWIARDRAEIDEFDGDADPTLLGHATKLSSPDGKVYFLPYVFNTIGIWYRKSLLQAAGVAAPAPGWTWDDFYAAAKATTRGDTFGFNATPGYFNGILPWLLTNGADILSPDWTTSTVNSPKAVEAVAFVARLVAEGISPKPGGAFDELDAFSSGNLAMIGCGRWAIEDVRDAGMVDDVGIVPWPVRTGPGSGVGWGSWGLMKNSPNKDAGWAFVKFLLTRDTQDFIGQTAFTGAIPVRRSSASGPSTTTNSPTGTEYLYDALRYATPVPGPDKSNLIQQAVEDGYQQILAGAITPAAGLAQIDGTIAGAL